MPEIIHDVAALRDLQEAMHGVYMDIIGPQERDFEYSANDAGHGRAADAIASFYDGWNDGRETVRDSLYARLQNLKTVIAGYEGMEHSLSHAFGASAASGDRPTA